VGNIGEHETGMVSSCSLTVRIPASLKGALQRVAMDDDRSVNYIVKIFLQKCVHAWEQQKNFEAKRARNEEEEQA